MRIIGAGGFILFLVVLTQIAKSYWGFTGQLSVLGAVAILWLFLWLLNRYLAGRIKAMKRELAELDAEETKT